MIRLIDIRLNAAHPELPLAEAVTYTGAPSTILIRGVPPNCGRWEITTVFVAASFPDGSTSTRAAVQSANGVWVATLPATATSGRTANGVRIMADGIDEHGEAVTGYILGVADFAVASLDVTPSPAPGETNYQMIYFDTMPGTLRKGDVTKIDGTLKIYNGTAWEPFADAVPLVKDVDGNKTAVTIGSRYGIDPVGANSLTNGYDVTASGLHSHAEGSYTTASGDSSHAEGSYTTASGDSSHAEGLSTTASGDFSHAEGYGTKAAGIKSHAEGIFAQTRAEDTFAFAWNGDGTVSLYDPYTSNGPGTFNINPAGGVNGFFIGKRTLSAIINDVIAARLSAIDPEKASVYDLIKALKGE